VEQQTQAPEPDQEYKLADFITVRQWLQSQPEGGKFSYESYEVFAKFVKRHRAELRASGEFIPTGTGVTRGLVGPGFDRVVFAILRREVQS
jgi:hypothetical protein